jgi:hypothetical protein
MQERLRGLLTFDEPPHRLAAAFALGVFIAFSPWLGLHLVSAVALAWALRLNKVVVLTASLLNNPWTIVPLYVFCLWSGIRITGQDVSLPELSWDRLGFSDLFTVLRPFLWPFIAGTLVIGAVAAVISYFLFAWAIKRYRTLEKR